MVRRIRNDLMISGRRIGSARPIGPRCGPAIGTIALACLCLISLNLAGCAVYKAAAAPSQKDLTVLKPGTSRERVIAELGAPIRTEKTGDHRKDIFTFVQGYSTGSKSGLAIVTAIEDIATLGAADFALRESAEERTGKKMTVAVYYDESDLVTNSETILVTQP